MNRRSFLGGLLVAPAIVRATSLDGLALLRRTPMVTTSITSIDIQGIQMFINMSDGTIIGPLPLPPPIPIEEALQFIKPVGDLRDGMTVEGLVGGPWVIRT